MKVVSLKQHLEVDAPDGFRRFRTIVSPAIGRTRLNSSGTFYESRAIRAGGSPNRPSAQLRSAIRIREARLALHRARCKKDSFELDAA